MDQAKCPDCGRVSVVRAKLRYAKPGEALGWVCSSRRNGCGMQFEAGEPRILSQLPPQQVEAVRRSVERVVGSAQPKSPDPMDSAREWLRGRSPGAVARQVLEWMEAHPAAPGETPGMHRVRWAESNGAPPSVLVLLRDALARAQPAATVRA